MAFFGMVFESSDWMGQKIDQTKTIAAPLLNFFTLLAFCGLLALSPATTWAQSTCAEVFQTSPQALWINDHFINAERLSKDQKNISEDFIRLFWPKLSLAPAHVKIHVLPEDTQLTDLADFRFLKGKTVGEVSEDHKNHAKSAARLWDDIRGCAAGGLCVVGLETFMPKLEGRRHILFHEMGHIMDHLLLTRTEKDRIKELYQAAKNRNLFINQYSSLNSAEYFAEAVEAFAGKTKDPAFVEPHHLSLTQENLKSTDPDLYDFVTSLTQ